MCKRTADDLLLFTGHDNLFCGMHRLPVCNKIFSYLMNIIRSWVAPWVISQLLFLCGLDVDRECPSSLEGTSRVKPSHCAVSNLWVVLPCTLRAQLWFIKVNINDWENRYKKLIYIAGEISDSFADDPLLWVDIECSQTNALSWKTKKVCSVNSYGYVMLVTAFA